MFHKVYTDSEILIANQLITVCSVCWTYKVEVAVIKQERVLKLTLLYARVPLKDDTIKQYQLKPKRDQLLCMTMVHSYSFSLYDVYVWTQFDVNLPVILYLIWIYLTRFIQSNHVLPRFNQSPLYWPSTYSASLNVDGNTTENHVNMPGRDYLLQQPKVSPFCLTLISMFNISIWCCMIAITISRNQVRVQ